jgi:hypothetical protein
MLMIIVIYYININCTDDLSVLVNINKQHDAKTKAKDAEMLKTTEDILNTFNRSHFISQEQTHSQTFASFKAFYH